MSGLANCPECGGAVSFSHPASILSVCSYCHSVLARKDVNLEKIGKLGVLSLVPSPLCCGMRGAAYGGFQVVGRLQLSHGAGTWNEWYLGLDNGKWLWLAEVQGRYYLTAPIGPVAEGAVAPPFAKAQVGRSVRLPRPGGGGRGDDVVMRVAEVQTGSLVSAEGELPFRVVPGEALRYIDLSGPSGTFGTLDYGAPGSGGGSSEILAYAGKEIELAELQLDLSTKAPDAADAPSVKAARMSCPSCQGALELRAPDATERVTCPYCRALVDVTKAPLRALTTLKAPAHPPRFALGATATLRGSRYTVIGHMRRGVVKNGHIDFTWDEYVLLVDGAKLGGNFHYLVESGGHFTLTRPINLGDVSGKGPLRIYQGTRFRSAETCTARVSEIAGEFPWAVEVGETVADEDFAAPGLLLSLEVSGGQHQEIVASLGEYIEPEEVYQAFSLSQAPQRRTFIAPHQPNPYVSRLVRHKRIYFSVVSVLLLAMIGFSIREKGRQQVHSFDLSTVAGAEPAAENVFLSDPFDLGPPGNKAALEYEISAQVEQSWVATDVALINDEDGTTYDFGVEVSYYHGSDDDGSWSEGSRTASVTVPEVPAGRYVLRIEPSWPVSPRALPYRATLRYGVSRPLYGLLFIFVLAIVPLWTWIRRQGFEKQREEDK